MSDARPVHLDTDPGLDDLLAIALALGSPRLRVESLTTVAGNAGLGAVTENAQRFLALARAGVTCTTKLFSQASSQFLTCG